MAIRDNLKQSLNVRYNSDTDMVQIYFGGEWVDWKFGGLQVTWLYNEGAYNEDYPLELSTNYTYTASSAGDLSRKAPTEEGTSILFNPSTNYCSFVGTKDVIDLSNFSTLTAVYIYNGVEYEMSIDISSVAQAYVCFGETYVNGNLVVILRALTGGKSVSNNYIVNAINSQQFSNVAASVNLELKKWRLE